MNARSRAALAIAFLMGELNRPLRLPLAHISLEELWNCPDAVLARLLKLRPSETGRLAAWRRCFQAEAALARLQNAGIAAVTLGDSGYPACLAAIYDPPPALFWRSRSHKRMQDFMSTPRIAIVGARAATRYGIEAAGMLAEALSAAGICVTSGLAMGIDAAAHQGAVGATGGSIAVLGCGIDICYPRRHWRLLDALLDNGMVVSEYPPGIPPRPWRFPARNRIIAGLSQGVVVVEAREKSGALITAEFALEQGREVYAVPGGIFSPLSAGPNALLKSGAAPVTVADDILAGLGLPATRAAGQSAIDLTDDEKKIYRILDSECRHPDRVAVSAGLPVHAVAAALVSLELKGLAASEPGLGYCRRR